MGNNTSGESGIQAVSHALITINCYVAGEYLAYEVLTAVNTLTAVFWVGTPCSHVGGYEGSGGGSRFLFLPQFIVLFALPVNKMEVYTWCI
jgi:hypothetical protein